MAWRIQTEKSLCSHSQWEQGIRKVEQLSCTCSFSTARQTRSLFWLITTEKKLYFNTAFFFSLIISGTKNLCPSLKSATLTSKRYFFIILVIYWRFWVFWYPKVQCLQRNLTSNWPLRLSAFFIKHNSCRVRLHGPLMNSL